MKTVLIDVPQFSQIPYDEQVTIEIDNFFYVRGKDYGHQNLIVRRHRVGLSRVQPSEYRVFAIDPFERYLARLDGIHDPFFRSVTDTVVDNEDNDLPAFAEGFANRIDYYRKR
jgi:hypothetical protein